MSQVVSLINNNFGGIRKKDTAFSDEKITCSDCQNVELFYTGLNSGVGVRTANGNKSATRYTVEEVVYELIPDGEDVIGIFETLQDGYKYIIVYTESLTEGKLYNLNLLGKTITPLVTDLSVTGDACGTDFTQGWLDMFIFSNGVEVKYIYSDTEEHSVLQVEKDSFKNKKLYSISDNEATEVADDATATGCKLTATINSNPVNLIRKRSLDTTIDSTSYYCWGNDTNNYYTDEDVDVYLLDTEGRFVSGLGLVSFDSRLWIFNGKSLWYSKQGECRDFNYIDVGIKTSAGYIDFTKDITAIHEYLGSLAVFHRDSSVLVMLDGTTGFKCDEESPGGCAGYNALVFHGTDLYFYDDTKKGIFSFKQIINGDKTLGENIAYDIQEQLLGITQDSTHKIRALSVVTEDRNEVWFLTPIVSTYPKKVDDTIVDVDASIIMIFDYIRGEWIKRKTKKINAIGIIDNKVYSAGKTIYEEYTGEDFDGDFIESYYTCSIFNYGSDNTLKITKFPPRATLGGERKCHFWVEYGKNYNESKSKKSKELKTNTIISIGYYDRGYKYNTGCSYSSSINAVIKLPSTTFKALAIKFFTKDKSEAFSIKALEFSKLKVKQI